MTHNTKLTTLGLLATLAAASLTPALADKQNDKNNMRNLAIAGAAVAGYGLFSHNNTVALLGAGGAALAGSQYEKDRRQQSQDNANRNQRYYRRGGSNGYNTNNGYRYDSNGYRYDNSGYHYDRSGNRYDSNGNRCDENGRRYDENSNRRNDSRWQNRNDNTGRDSGDKQRGQGWYENHGSRN